MAFPVKQVRTLEEQLRIIEEVEKNPSERRTDVAKRLGLPPSTLNTIIDDDEAEPEPVPSFTEALRAFESMRVSMHAHDITKRDQANIVNIKSLLFNLKRKDATKQIKINDFLKKKT
jgi:hypothetical protein